jgi:hypothetical protein
MVGIAERVAGLSGALQVGMGGGLSGSPTGWQDIVANIASGKAGTSASPIVDGRTVGQLTNLLLMQMEVCRYQVKVEVVSKIAESAVASMRKLQQPT